MATPIRTTCLRLSAGPRCALPKLALSIARSAKLTASVCARSKKLGSFSAPPLPNPKQAAPVYGNGNGSSHSQPRLRDQLCLLIRQFNLDPTLVKAYAVDFCGTEALKEASRDLVESFIAHISKAANEDRNALICKLNSYAPSVEVKP